MSQIEKLRKLLTDRNISAVARGAGVHKNTLYRLKNGAVNVKYETLRVVLEYLEKAEK